MSVTITLDTVLPATIQENEPFRVSWTLTAADGFPARALTLVLLTDDARVLLADAATQESPPEKQVSIAGGQKLQRTSVLTVQRRKGLVDENSRDGSSSPLCILARVRDERDDTVATGGDGIEVQVVGLARRQNLRIFA